MAKFSKKEKIEAVSFSLYIPSRRSKVLSNYKGEKFYELGSAVSDANLITASGIAPLEFAMEVLKK